MFQKLGRSFHLTYHKTQPHELSSLVASTYQVRASSAKPRAEPFNPKRLALHVGGRPRYRVGAHTAATLPASWALFAVWLPDEAPCPRSPHLPSIRTIVGIDPNTKKTYSMYTTLVQRFRGSALNNTYSTFCENHRKARAQLGSGSAAMQVFS